MTGPGRDDIRDTLAAALRKAPEFYAGSAKNLAAALTPAVRRIAADELRAAGRRGFFTQAGQAWAAERVDELDPR